MLPGSQIQVRFAPRLEPFCGLTWAHGIASQPHEKQNLPHCEMHRDRAFLREQRAPPGAWDALRPQINHPIGLAARAAAGLRQACRRNSAATSRCAWCRRATRSSTRDRPPGTLPLHPLVGKGRARDVATQLLQPLAVDGAAAHGGVQAESETQGGRRRGGVESGTASRRRSRAGRLTHLRRLARAAVATVVPRGVKGVARAAQAHLPPAR